jgi:hypothetical protein
VIAALAWSLLSNEPSSHVEFHAPVPVAAAPTPTPAEPEAPPPAPAAPVAAPSPAPAGPGPSPAAADAAEQPSDEMDIGGLINTARGNLAQLRVAMRDKRKLSAQLEALNSKRMAARDPRQKYKAEAALRGFIKKHKLG